MLRPLLGPHVLNELAVAKPRHWTGANALGSIAGTLRMGTGQFFAHFDEDNDGTVAVSETMIPGLADHLYCRTATSACCSPGRRRAGGALSADRPIRIRRP